MPSQHVRTLGPAVTAAVGTMRSDLVAAEVVAALGSAGVRAILLKGPSLTHWLYDAPGDRPYVDCDLLVAPQDKSAAEAVLRRLGYAKALADEDTPGWRQAAHRWSRGRDHPEVDLHRTITGVKAPDQQLWEALGSDTRTIVVAEADVDVLSPSARALHIALHAAQHGPRFPRPLRDLERALEVVDQATWGAAADLARQLDATDAFGAGLRLLSLGRVLASHLGLPPSSSMETALLAASPPPGALGLLDLAGTPGAFGKARVAARKLVPTVRFMREWSSLARRGRLGLAAAYVWRPLWVLLQLAPGVAAWLGARRAVRRGASLR